MLDLNEDTYCILHWLAVLLENREFDSYSALAHQAKKYISEVFHVNYQKYDCIIGYRADDSYFSFAQDFLNGTISYRQINNAMHLGKLGYQFVLKSRKAFERITFTGYEIANSKEWYTRRTNRDLAALRNSPRAVRAGLHRQSK
ncbi:MAG: DUF3990 domain-containing protein [Lachnospiraceae bacterium]|nr:DUF3990 domain-containing protein [Lachnospiraceae bacterium]